MVIHRRMIMVTVFAFLSNSVLLAALKHDQTIPQQRSMKYTSRPKEDAGTWQKNVRFKLFQLLKMDKSLQRRNSIPFSPKELSHADRGTYHIMELEINSTSSRRIRIVVTIPNSKDKPVPAVVCIGGHGSNLYSPYDPKTITGQGSRKKSDSIYKGFGTVLTERGYVTISATVSQHEVYEKGRLLMAERLWDLIRCVDYLQSMSEVDGSRIGCGGLSLGGEMAMWLGAMDERIAATVSAGFLTTMDHMEQNHCMCWKFEGLREQVDFADIYSLTAPRPLQCQNGMLEPASQFYVPLARRAMEEIRTIYKDMERPENIILNVHEEGHVIDLPGLIYFFEKHLYQNRWK
ncbi:MAG: alpha/beta hydrolase family protein [Sedimentisphaerales bacterium]|nr:alpha/beta hydrolase family protein [Sedimentisphaerales bacterium]